MTNSNSEFFKLQTEFNNSYYKYQKLKQELVDNQKRMSILNGIQVVIDIVGAANTAEQLISNNNQVSTLKTDKDRLMEEIQYLDNYNNALSSQIGLMEKEVKYLYDNLRTQDMKIKSFYIERGIEIPNVEYPPIPLY